MIKQSPREKASKTLIIAILIIGPALSFIGWLIFERYISAGIEVYILISVTMILLFAVWAWMGKPSWPFGGHGA